MQELAGFVLTFPLLVMMTWSYLVPAGLAGIPRLDRSQLMEVAIVTGGSSGIGASTAVQLAQRGRGVILTYNSNKQGALDTVATIERDGGTAVALPLDIGAAGDFPAFRAAASDALGTVWQRDSFDYLVNNAGIGHGLTLFA